MALRDFISGPELDYVREVLESGHLTCLSGGTMTERFETEFAKMMGAKYAEAMCTGMALMHSALLAFGVGVGDEVLCDPMVAFGALATRYCGAVPVFVDVKPVTMNMDPDKIEEQITERTKAIIVTHLWGLPAEIDRIVEIAHKHGLKVLEDCAHAILATYKGKHVGTWGDIGFYSFQMTKQLGLGDGTIGVTDEPEMKRQLGLMGGAPTFHSVAYDIHYNYRITEVVSAIGLGQLTKIKGYITHMQKNASLFDKAVEELPFIVVQKDPNAVHTYHFWSSTFVGEEYGLSLEDLKRVLAEEEVGAMIGYTNLTAYQQPFMTDRTGHGLDCPDYKGDKNRYWTGMCPNAEYILPRTVGLYTFIEEHAAKETAERFRKALSRL